MIATSAKTHRAAKTVASRTWVAKNAQRLRGGHATTCVIRQTPTPSSAAGSTYQKPWASDWPALIGCDRVMMTEYIAANGNHAAAYKAHICTRTLVIGVPPLLYFSAAARLFANPKSGAIASAALYSSAAF